MTNKSNTELLARCAYREFSWIDGVEKHAPLLTPGSYALIVEWEDLPPELREAFCAAVQAVKDVLSCRVREAVDAAMHLKSEGDEAEEAEARDELSLYDKQRALEESYRLVEGKTGG